MSVNLTTQHFLCSFTERHLTLLSTLFLISKASKICFISSRSKPQFFRTIPQLFTELEHVEILMEPLVPCGDMIDTIVRIDNINGYLLYVQAKPKWNRIKPRISMTTCEVLFRTVTACSMQDNVLAKESTYQFYLLYTL